MDYIQALTEQSDLFGRLIADADHGVPVPTCPGWSVGELIRHVGRGDRWAAQIVGDRMDGYLEPKQVRDGKPPADPAELLPWLRGSARAVADAVAEVGADTPVWTFIGPRPAIWWVRRRLHEWTVHRADAALALGVEFELSPELSADCISEWLGLVTALRGGDGPAALAPGVTLHLHATDEGLGAAGEWLIRGEDGGVAWESSHAKADTAVRGRAVELMQVLVRRRPADAADVQLFGDPAVLAGWLARTGF